MAAEPGSHFVSIVACLTHPVFVLKRVNKGGFWTANREFTEPDGLGQVVSAGNPGLPERTMA